MGYLQAGLSKLHQETSGNALSGSVYRFDCGS